MWDENKSDLMDISLYFTSEPVSSAKVTASKTNWPTNRIYT